MVQNRVGRNGQLRKFVDNHLPVVTIRDLLKRNTTMTYCGLVPEYFFPGLFGLQKLACRKNSSRGE